MPNSLTNLVDKLLARGVLALREQAVMPRLVNGDYSSMGAMKGATIDIPVGSALSAVDVTPSVTPGSAQDSTPTLVQVPLDQWKEVSFFLTDKQRMEIDENESFMPQNVSEAVRRLANVMDARVHAQYVDVYGYVGTAGTTPFSASVADVVNARAVLNKQLAPMSDRRMVLNPDAEANLLQVPAMSDLERTGDPAVKIQGRLGTKFGFDFFQTTNIVTHTAGTAASISVASTTAAGATSLDVLASVNGTLVVGDIISVAGNTQTYVITALATLTSTKQAVTIQPPLVAIASSTSDVTRRASHVVNLAFNREAFVFVNRPLANAGGGAGLGTVMREMSDPVSGLTMRMEVSRQNKQERFAMDVLYGAKTLRPQYATRVAG
jgi:hypothetical protein